MSDRSRIEWTDATWNPVTGCTAVSIGCENCYAKRMAGRLRSMHVRRYRQGFEVKCHPDQLTVPDHWRKSRHVFVCSMGDLFHEEVPDDYIGRVFEVMVRNPAHVFQVLTKRSRRLRELAPLLAWPHNIWAGVTVECDGAVPRIRDLAAVPAAVRFASCEPLLSPLTSMLTPTPAGPAEIDVLGWVIVGGETGPGAREMMHPWVTEIRDACVERQIPFFFKQWGDRKRNWDRTIDRVSWAQLPACLVREV